ncbi:flagellar biosynthetic protein FliO [Bosea minatitlanensis]|uniref:flagellar biosynthetic protein FliO n=1 Tax=Bosea minatitlanensis TaxID=128782 RepID=UPI0021A80E50|nr:flagellar biosynthetic protein FliO [Bosea minatitlanensis]MCT4492226.1 flagellar biosynthetic protein FliO [Bosea minatitlanensis]
MELTTPTKVIIASVVILALLLLLGLFVRQIQGGRLRMRGQTSGRQRQPRLGIVDSYDLDRQRQLVLIRRDNVEHLIMLGGASDVVVETNILRSGARALAPAEDKPAPSAAAEEAERKPAASEPPKQPEPAKEIDPFSVDAIEAEFARLLGRDLKPKS